MWFSVDIFCPTLEKKFGLSRFKLGPKKGPGKSFPAKSLDFLDLTNTFSFFNDSKGTPCQNFSAYFYLDSHVTGMTNGACKGSGCGKLIEKK